MQNIFTMRGFNKEFVLTIDASTKGLGYFLGQRDSAGRLRVNFYGVRGLWQAEKFLQLQNLNV